MKTEKAKNGDFMVFETTGKKVYANNFIIGISPELNITEGYDGGFGSYDMDDNLTKDEVIELSDYMIKTWQAFRQKYAR